MQLNAPGTARAVCFTLESDSPEPSCTATLDLPQDRRVVSASFPPVASTKAVVLPRSIGGTRPISDIRSFEFVA